MDFYKVSDCVHGEIVLPSYVRDVIETPQFQRLKNLKQLGSTSYVFRTAKHNRAQHCIGTAFLCQQLLEILERNSDRKIDDLLKKCVILGGLLHDLGHGPFSHLWEGVVHRGTDVTWTHENQSEKMIEFMMESNKIRLDEAGPRHEFALKLINSLITGDYKTWADILRPDEFFITEIVSNKLCNIDVDKIDYILRDQKYVNHVELRPFEKFLDRARIAYDSDGVSHIAYHADDFDLIENLFYNRAYLHMNVYQHRLVAGCERMVTDICVNAAVGGVTIENLPLTDVHFDQNAFLKLDDTVLDVVRTSQIDNPMVRDAQKILKNLETGRHYECVWEAQDDGKEIYNSLVAKFGDIFCIVGKKIPAANVPGNIPLYRDESLVSMTSNLELCFESSLIYCKIPEVAGSAKQFTDSLNNNI